jgi:ABC-type sugar transport system ATPase subunit
MKVLIVGGGGREHALAWKIAQSPKVSRIYCAPGNEGISKLAECVPIAADDLDGLLNFALDKKIDLTVIGPEDPLVLGIVDLFQNHKLAVFGPSKKAAEIEGSKSMAKDLMEKYGIPTAKYSCFNDPDLAKLYIKDKGVPCVIKADGLAAGKGVIIATKLEEAMEAVHLDYKSLKDRSPFALSGGQMRRVAIAGVLAMRPEVLILDEPTAGLDPKGREDILEEIAELHQNLQITVILVSHSMEDIARYTNRVVVMSEGKIALNGSAQEIFTRVEELENLGLGIPMVSVLMHRLKNQGIPVPVDIFTVADAKEAILKWQRGKKNA